MPAELDPQLLVDMRRRRTYLAELSREQREVLFDSVVAEYDTQGLAGESTQAFLGSVHGLIMMGVSRVRSSWRDDSSELYGFHDVYHQFLVGTNIGRMVARFKENTTPVSTFVIGRVFSQASRYVSKFGSPGVTYPGNVRTHAVMKNLAEAADLSWGPLRSPDFADAAYRSGQSDTVRGERVARSIWRMYTAEIIQPEMPTDEDVWEQRLLAEADDCDDELVTPGSIVTDLTAADDLETATDRVADVQRMRNLPWEQLSEKQRYVVGQYFGLDGPAQGLRSLASELQMTRQGVEYIKKTALALLRAPLAQQSEPYVKKSGKVEPPKKKVKPPVMTKYEKLQRKVDECLVTTDAPPVLSLEQVVQVAFAVNSLNGHSPIILPETSRQKVSELIVDNWSSFDSTMRRYLTVRFGVTSGISRIMSAMAEKPVNKATAALLMSRFERLVAEHLSVLLRDSRLENALE